MLLLIQKWKYCNLKDIEEDGNMYSNYFFHVHTRRCKHASDENNEKYIQRALQLGANKIVYTDHVPFPEDRWDAYHLCRTYTGYRRALKEEREELPDCGQRFPPGS